MAQTLAMRAFSIFLFLIGGILFAFSEMDQSIRSIDFEKHYMPRALDARELCSSNQPLLGIFEIEYSDLDGDGSEEAVVEAQTCGMSQGGCDILEVVKLTKNGLIALPIANNEKLRIPDGYARAGSRSYRLDVRNGILLFWYPVYKIGQDRWASSLVWSVTFKWNGKEFIPDQVKIDPAQVFHQK